MACALALVDAGRRVVVHEAARSAGGRCRALPDGTDNGTHALLGANHAARALLARIGATADWVEPEPDGLPVHDRRDGTNRRVALHPLGWLDPARRPAGLGVGAIAATLRLALPWPDRPIAGLVARHPEFLRGFVEPLTIAALNTPAREASSARLGAVLRRIRGRDDARLLVARRGLGSDLVDPALAALAAAGATVRFGRRLRGVTPDALEFEGATLPLGPGDTAILALPPWEVQRILPGVAGPVDHAPIVNLHFAHPTPGPVRFLGVLDGLCQWVLVRPEGIAVTISAGDAEADTPAATLLPRAWAEIRALARAWALPGDWPDAPPPGRAVKERRATPRHRPGRARRLAPQGRFVLAGDWTEPSLPATIEAAVRSGNAAAARVLRGG